jgi:hypothetical protein
VACISEKKVHTFFWFENMKKVMYENLCINEGNMKTELKKRDMMEESGWDSSLMGKWQYC